MTCTAASGKSSSPPAWSKSRWVRTMWRTSRRANPSRSTWASAVRRRVEPDAVHVDEQRAQPPVGMLHVADAEARVDQHQAGIRLDEEAVADEKPGRAAADPVPDPSAERAHAAAVEVMDAQHRRSLAPRRDPQRIGARKGCRFCSCGEPDVRFRAPAVRLPGFRQGFAPSKPDIFEGLRLAEMTYLSEGQIPEEVGHGAVL